MLAVSCCVFTAAEILLIRDAFSMYLTPYQLAFAEVTSKGSQWQTSGATAAALHAAGSRARKACSIGGQGSCSVHESNTTISSRSSSLQEPVQQEPNASGQMATPQQWLRSTPRGAYTTVWVQGGTRLMDWPTHLERLARSLQALHAALAGFYEAYYAWLEVGDRPRASK